MQDYISLRIETTPSSEDISDLLASFLADIGFESFEPDEKGVTAYIKKELFDEESVRQILIDFPIETDFSFSHEVIKGEDWNEEWEKNYYKPIVIDERCVVRSTFHKDAPKKEIEIIIDPKMAFGTGHHFTTANMIRLLLEENLKGKSVIDMGTGTGILAILCKKLGAEKVTGIEIDPFALENAEENGELNGVNIKWICGDVESLKETDECDFFLANINRNVILTDFDKYVASLKKNGMMLLSGFYESDEKMIEDAAKSHSLKKIKRVVDNEWVAIEFQKI